MFKALDHSDFAGVILCLFSALAIGVGICYAHRYKNPDANKKMYTTLILIPIITSSLIMTIGSNVAAGIAVFGAFNLIRFRSAPGNFRDICAIFFAMSQGVMIGYGLVTLAFVTAAFIAGVILVLASLPEPKTPEIKTMKLVISTPESLDFESEFADILEKYSHRHYLKNVKTSQMGSIFVVQYIMNMKDLTQRKALMDELRSKNSNLPVSCSPYSNKQDNLLVNLLDED